MVETQLIFVSQLWVPLKVLQLYFDLKSLAHITQHIKVLDCGCADGRNSEYLMNLGFKTIDSYESL